MAQGQRSWPIGVALGLVLAVAVPFMLDYINDTIKTPEDVARQLKVPFLGLVPSVRGDKYPLLASSHVPHDFGEAFRSLRTALLSQYEAAGTKVVLFTSAQPLEGKTTTAVNMAMALAYGGARVLVIDADMRRPGLHRPLRLTNDRGLSQVLVGQARVRDVIQRTVDPNLLAITAGKVPPNPSELLTSERMKTLLTNLAHGPFDWIIIDTPPVLAVTDAVVVAPLVSGVVFVIGAEMTRRRLAERAIGTVMSARPKQVAVVLNKVDFVRNKYLLFALLRPPVQELLRTGDLAPSPVCSPPRRSSGCSSHSAGRRAGRLRLPSSRSPSVLSWSGRRSPPSQSRALDIALLCCLAWTVLQTVPLPPGWREILSPNADAIDRALRFDGDVPRPRPLSIDPLSTLAGRDCDDDGRGDVLDCA